jgi:dTMP kinase
VRGRLITFEGGEGAGKSLQLQRLAQFLSRLGIDVVTTREPGGTETAEAIRTFLLSDLAGELGPDAEAVLFAAARADHVDKLIRPALERGSWILSDRFFDSTEAYQGAEGGVDRAFLRKLKEASVGGIRPDLTLIFDLPVEVAMARVGGRTSREKRDADRYERGEAERHERRRQAFLAIAAREPDRCIVVDANREPDPVFETVREVVEARLLASVE